MITVAGDTEVSPFFDVRRYGAIGDGQVDDTGAVVDAIKAATAAGGTVLFPAGTFLIQTFASSPALPLIIKGVGAATVIKLSPVSVGSDSILRFGGSQSLLIENVVFDGNDVPLAGSAGSLLYLNLRGDASTVIRNVEFRNSGNNAVYARDSAIDLSGCWIHDCARDGITAQGSRPTRITNNLIEGVESNGMTISFYGASVKYQGHGVVVSNNTVRNVINSFGGAGASGNGILLFYCSHVVVSDNNIENVEWSFIRCNKADYVTITGNVCRQNVANTSGIFFELGAQWGVVSNNVVDDVQGSGISIANLNDGLVGASVCGNLVTRFGKSGGTYHSGIGIEHGVCTGNVIDGTNNPGAVAGIKVGPGGGTSLGFNVVVGLNQIAGTKYAIAIPASNSGTIGVQITSIAVWRQDANWSSFFGAVGSSNTDIGDGAAIAAGVADDVFVADCFPGVPLAARPPAMREGSRLVVDGSLMTSLGGTWV